MEPKPPNPYFRARRRHPRLNCGKQPCRFSLVFVNDRPVDLSEGRGATVNLSRGGFCMKTHLRLPENVPVLVRARFSLQGRLFRPYARLKWVKPSQDHDSYEYGFSYVGWDPGVNADLYRHLDELRIDYRA